MNERLLLHAMEGHKLGKERSDLSLEIISNIIVPFTGSNIFFAQTDSGLNVVVKTPVHTIDAKREWSGLNKTHKAGVAVPQPIALVIDDKGKYSTIVQKIEGYNLNDQPTDSVKHSLGVMIQSMHKNTKIQGIEWVKSGRSNFSYYDKWQFYWMQGPEKILHSKSVTLALLNKFASNMQDYCKKTSPVFNHNDLHDGQIIVDGITPTLIDFENWKEESRLNDIAFYIFHSIRTNRSGNELVPFLNGYFENSNLDEQEKSVLMFYLIFISARAVSYFLQKKSDYLETAKITHKKVLEYVDKEKLWKITNV